MPSEPLLGPSYATAPVRAALDDEAWLQAMLDVEAALAGAAADAGLVERADADAVAEQCRADRFDLAGIGARAATAGNPVIPLVADLRTAVPDHAARAVHVGATSQDVIDTSLMLLARRTIPDDRRRPRARRQRPRPGWPSATGTTSNPAARCCSTRCRSRSG